VLHSVVLVAIVNNKYRQLDQLLLCSYLLKGRAFGNLGLSNESLGRYEEAVAYQLKLLHVASEIKDNAAKTLALTSLGECFRLSPVAQRVAVCLCLSVSVCLSVCHCLFISVCLPLSVRDRTGRLIIRLKQGGYLPPENPSFVELAEKADKTGFNAITINLTHALSKYLPNFKTEGHNLRPRGISMSFQKRMA